MQEHHLLRHHTGLDVPDDEAAGDALVTAARRVFRCDVAKSCHHGSADFTDLFLRALDPVATVVSSGDDEPYSHPRSDTLGAIGRRSRGSRPLIFSTELARSAPERLEHPFAVRKEIKDLRTERDEVATKAERDAIDAKIDALLEKHLDRSVAIYGAINLRTDGDRVVLAQRIEKAAGAVDVKKWDAYALERDLATGELAYRSKHQG